MELFPVPPIELRKYYVLVSDFRRAWDRSSLYCVLTPALFAYYSGTMGNYSPRLPSLLREIERTELVISTFVCLVRMVEFRVRLMFVRQRLGASMD